MIIIIIGVASRLYLPQFGFSFAGSVRVVGV